MQGAGHARAGSGRAARRRPHIPVAVVSGLLVGVASGLFVVHGGVPALADGSEESAGESDSRELAQVSGELADAGAVEAASDTDEPAADAAVAEKPDAAPPDAGVDDDGVADGPESDRDGPDRPAQPPPRTVRLSFDVRPRDAGNVSIRVDGERVSGRAHPVHVEGRFRRVRVQVRAHGFLNWSQRVRVGRDRTIRVDLERPVSTDDGPGSSIDLGL